MNERLLIIAGGADQQTMEGPEGDHSVFGYCLLQGLADLNDDGIIPTSQLYAYLDPEGLYRGGPQTLRTAS